MRLQGLSSDSMEIRPRRFMLESPADRADFRGACRPLVADDLPWGTYAHVLGTGVERNFAALTKAATSRPGPFGQPPPTNVYAFVVKTLRREDVLLHLGDAADTCARLSMHLRRTTRGLSPPRRLCWFLSQLQPGAARKPPFF